MSVNWKKPIEAISANITSHTYPARVVGTLLNSKYPNIIAILVEDMEIMLNTDDYGKPEYNPSAHKTSDENSYPNCWTIRNFSSHLLLSGWFCYEEDIEDGFVTPDLEVKIQVKSRGFKVFPINVKLQEEI